MKIDSTTQRHIISAAQTNGICAAWLEELRKTDDTRQLMRMYVRGIDFCLMNEYPDMETMRRYRADAQAAGIYVDSEGMRTKNRARTVCLGTTAGLIQFDERHAGAVYIKHDSSVTVVASGDSFAMVDVFDSAKLNVEARDRARVCVNIYAEEGAPGPAITVSRADSATIKVINKNKKTYK